jgi:uncharacterized membrane protein
MFSISESISYGWQKMKENMKLSIITTLVIGIISILSGMDNVFGFIFVIIGMIAQIGYTKIYLKLNEGEKPEWKTIFKEYALFWKYLAVSILQGLIVFVGILLLIIPGLIWSVRFAFAGIIVVDTKSGPIVALKESYRITKGSFWKLWGFWLALIGVNIIGAVLVGIGLLFTIPLSTLALIHVYRKLSSAKAAIGTPTPAPIPTVQ